MAPILPVHMPMQPPIQGTAAPILTPPAVGASGGTAGGSAFQSILADSISQVENFGNIAETSVNNFLSGEGDELHQVAIKAQQASLSFDLFLQVRNKIVAAYQSVMNMQV